MVVQIGAFVLDDNLNIVSEKVAGIAAEITCYKVDDVFEDSIFELSDVANIEISLAREIQRKSLLSYHFKVEKESPNFDRDVVHLALNFNQKGRIPIMTTRMDWVIEQTKKMSGCKTVLDYGGGAGRDSIIYAKLGYAVTYCDILSNFTEFVRNRFRKRNLEIDVYDVRDLGEQRFDIIHCVDVLEHIYDLEYAVADIFARLNEGGHLIVYPSFYNSWNGDHVEKNCAYRPYFVQLLTNIGLDILSNNEEVYHFRKNPQITGSVFDERESTRKRLYEISEILSFSAAKSQIDAIHEQLSNNALNEHIVNTVIDNLAVFRLSRQRLGKWRLPV
jgi:SAM-dependent methyltransferase